jgi:hypothetical protein
MRNANNRIPESRSQMQAANGGFKRKVAWAAQKKPDARCRRAASVGSTGKTEPLANPSKSWQDDVDRVSARDKRLIAFGLVHSTSPDRPKEEELSFDRAS